MKKQKYATVTQYIANFPPQTQDALKKIRSIIHKVAPAAEEKISYGIPTYKVGKRPLHFGGYDKHIGLYPGAAGVAAFANRLKDYETSKGTIRFYLDQALPYDLIEDIARYCLMG
jgi:uncharacterized protein YdhG (YjbR/CyaY superfamily)